MQIWNKKSPRYLGGPCLLAVWTGLEPATPCVTGRYSNQLNYQTNDFIRFRRTPATAGFKSCSYAFGKRVRFPVSRCKYTLLFQLHKQFFLNYTPTI